MRDRLRILIVSFYFPPAGGGGVQRILKWAKYLPAEGVDVHVLTPDDPRWIDVDPDLEIPDGIVVHRAPYRGLSPGKPREILQTTPRPLRFLRRLTLQPRRLLVPDVVATWRLTAVRAGVEAVRRNGIDLVLSTSPPPTDHVVARGIADRCAIPMVADLRDSWLNDPRLRLTSPVVRLKRRLAARLEQRTVAGADAIVTAAPAIGDELAVRYPNRAQSIHTIENGVDLSDYAAEPDLEEPQRFVVTHTGGFFGLRRPGPFLDAVEELAQRRPDLGDRLLVRFVGQVPPDDRARIAASPVLADCVECSGFLPYREALAHQLAADALLLLIPDTPDRVGMVTGKLFEYLGARRRILALVPPSGAAAKLVRDTASGEVHAPAATSEVAGTLESWLDEWQPGSAPRELPPLAPEVGQRISRQGGAARLAAILRSVTPDGR